MENYENEVWRPIKGYEGFYEVSSCGRVRSLKRKAPHILKPFFNPNCYLKVNLCKNGKSETELIHRLVAEAFIPNPDNLPTVDHINRDKQDNSVENLRWASNTEQIKNRIKNLEHSPETKLRVLCVETQTIFDNSAAAARQVQEQGLSDTRVSTIAQQIRKVCNKGYGYKTAYGYHWEFYYEG